MNPENRGDHATRPAPERICDVGHPDPDLWDDNPVETRPAPDGFDYDSLPEALRQQAREHAAAIHELLGARNRTRAPYLGAAVAKGSRGGGAGLLVGV